MVQGLTPFPGDLTPSLDFFWALGMHFMLSEAKHTQTMYVCTYVYVKYILKVVVAAECGTHIFNPITHEAEKGSL